MAGNTYEFPPVNYRSDDDDDDGENTSLLRQQITNNYKRLVAEVDPLREVMDHLIEAGVVNVETKDRINAVPGSINGFLARPSRKIAYLEVRHQSRLKSAMASLNWKHMYLSKNARYLRKIPKDKCRHLVDFILRSSNQKTYVAFCCAVKKHYPWLLPEVDETGNVKSLAGMLDINGDSLKDQLSAAKKNIRELEKTISDLTDKWTMSQAAVSVLEKQLSKALTNETSAANELQSARLNETTLLSEIDRLRQQLSKLGANPQQSSSPHLQKAASTDDVTANGLKFDAAYLCTLSDPDLQQSSKLKSIYGLTILNDQLYAARDRSNVVEAYDMKSFNKCRQLTLTNQSTTCFQCFPLDMTSCSAKQALYIADYAMCGVHRVDPNTGHVIKSWRVDGQAWGLSVTHRTTILVCCRGLRRIAEYSSTGEFLLEVTFDSDVLSPVHVHEIPQQPSPDDLLPVVTATRHYIVAHGGSQQPAAGNTSTAFHRVCEVDSEGHVLSSIGNVPGSAVDQFNQPYHLAVCPVSSVIMVADCGNGRIPVLYRSAADQQLSVIYTIVTEAYQVKPHRLCFCSATKRLFVGMWDGRVIVYQLAY